MRKIKIRYLIAGVFLSAASYAQVGGPGTVIVGGGTNGASGPATALQSPVVIEGTTADAFEGNFTFADPTADWTMAIGATGSVVFEEDVSADNFYSASAFYAGATSSASAEFAVDGSKVYMGSAIALGWTSTVTPEAASYVLDTQFTREAADVVKLDSVLELTPVASGGTCDAGNEGRIYTDTSHALCYCDGAAWQVLNPLTSGVGTCS